MFVHFDEKMTDWLNKMAQHHDCTPEDVVYNALWNYARVADLCFFGPKEHAWNEVKIIGVPFEEEQDGE